MSDSNWLKYGTIVIAAAAFLVLVGIAADSGGDIEGRNWVVTELTIDGTTAPPIEGTTITAVFDDGGVGGIATCNTYFGSYETNGSEISFSAMGSTLMFCSDPAGAMDQETAYLGLLGTVDAYEIDGDMLLLKQGSTVVVTYQESDAS